MTDEERLASLTEGVKINKEKPGYWMAPVASSDVEWAVHRIRSLQTLWQDAEKRLTGAHMWVSGTEEELKQAKIRIAELEFKYRKWERCTCPVGTYDILHHKGCGSHDGTE